MNLVGKEDININLKYSGKDVDDGSMSLEDFVPALQGFSSMYTKVAATKNLELEHKIRITGISKGSCDIHLQVWKIIAENSSQLEAIKTVGGGGLAILEIISALIKLTKHIKKQPHEAKISNVTNNIIIKNSENVTLEMPLEVYTLYKEETLANDLNKIVKPLDEGRVEKAEIVAVEKGQEIKESIDISEKPYFETTEPIATKTEEVWLMGKFNSLTKSTNKGYFLLNDGTRVTYRFAGEKPENMYDMFIYQGLVKVRCVASLDENLKPSFIEIFDIIKMQTNIDVDNK